MAEEQEEQKEDNKIISEDVEINKDKNIEAFINNENNDAPSKEDILLNILQEMKNNLDTAMSLLGEYDNRARSVIFNSGNNSNGHYFYCTFFRN